MRTHDNQDTMDQKSAFRVQDGSPSPAPVRSAFAGYQYGEGSPGPRPPVQQLGGIDAGQAVESIDTLLVKLFAIDLVVTVVLQRIYVGVSITLATHSLVVLLLLMKSRLIISPARVFMLSIWFAAGAVSYVVHKDTDSLSSFLLITACYLSFMFVAPANKPTYMSFINIYNTTSIAIAMIVILQFSMQLVGIPMLTMDWFVPPGMVAPTMAYTQPVTFKAGVFKPNGFFMLEPSFASQFICLGFVLELAFYRRIFRLCLLALAALFTFSGTGLVLVVLAMPFAARQHWRKLLAGGVVALPILIVLAVATGWWETNSQRLLAYDAKQSSAGQRFVLPYTNAWDLLKSGSPEALAFGYGPGETSNWDNVNIEFAEYSALPRVLIEYGILPVLLFAILVNGSILSSRVPSVAAWSMIVYYNFLGGNSTLPPIINYTFLIAAGWSLAEASPIRHRAPDV